MDLDRFEDYKQAVIASYKKKKLAGTLPPNLEDHTSANLRNECMAVFHKRYSDKDKETFKAFYGEKESEAEYYQKMKVTSPDKFKPLHLFLKHNMHKGTHYKNIELLAWLIDFEPRPHRPGDLTKILEKEQRESCATKLSADMPTTQRFGMEEITTLKEERAKKKKQHEAKYEHNRIYRH